MISTSAKQGFDSLLQQAMRNSMVPAGDHCEISVLAHPEDIKGERMVVLTVSSYLFRLMVMFHFTEDDATRAYFSRLSDTECPETGEGSVVDVIAEYGNLCCGILNRDLGRFFPHIGMSTPNVIDRHCVDYLPMLACDHIQHFAIDSDSGLRLCLTLCVTAYAEIDFCLIEEESEQSTGELELF